MNFELVLIKRKKLYHNMIFNDYNDQARENVVMDMKQANAILTLKDEDSFHQDRSISILMMLINIKE